MDRNGLFSYQLARTQDHGVTWTVEDLPLLAETVPDPEKAEMGWFDAQTGWISVKQSTGSNFSTGALFTTQDGGASWEQSWLPVADKVYFSDPLDGWAAGGPSGDRIFRTRDAGAAWQNLTTMELPANGHAMAYAPFVSGEAGLLVMTAGNSLYVFKLENSSNTWLPAGEVLLPVEPGVIGLSILDPQSFVASVPGTSSIVRMMAGHLDLLENTDGLSASIVDLDMVSMDIGWGRSVDSNCTAGSMPATQAGSVKCSSTTRLLRTEDGGRTWQVVDLPSVPSAVCPASSRRRRGCRGIGPALNLGQYRSPGRTGL